MISSSEMSSVSIQAFLFKIRDLCRDNYANMDENGNVLAELIYDDILFLQEVATLCKKGVLTLNLNNIFGAGDHTVDELNLSNIASYYEPAKGGPDRFEAIVKRLWTELGSETSQVKVIFKGREIPIRPPSSSSPEVVVNYKKCLYLILEYAGRVTPEFEEDTDPYEYFSKDNKKQKSKYYGQFYTPKLLILSVIKEIKPVWGDTMCDFAAGTSKFLRQAAVYANANDPEKRLALDAFTQMDSYEIESKIYRQGFISLFLSFGSIPDTSKIQLKNAFESLKDPKQYKKLVGNPPYGGTIAGFEDLYYTSESVPIGKSGKVKHTLKKRPEICFELPFIKNDTCVLFLQLYTVKLEVGGICGLILNGTIMNNQHRDVMKWFLTECNLYKIIVNPSGTFKNTSIETYSFIFTKGTPTQKIEYYTVETGEKLGEFTRTQLEANDWDIRPIFYKKRVDSLISYSPVSELCNIQKGVVQASKAVEGPYNCYSAAKEVGTHNEAMFTGPAVIFVNASRGSPLGRVHYARPGEKFAATSIVQILTPKEGVSIDMKYFWYYFELNKNIILETFKSSNMRETIQVEDLEKYQVPIPPIPIQEEIVTNLDRLFANPQDMKETLAFTDRVIDLMLQDPTGAQLEDLVESIRLRRHHQTSANSIKRQMAAVIRSISARGFTRGKLGDVCNAINGKPITSSEKELGGEYPVMGGGMDYVGNYSKFNREGETISISKSGASSGIVKYHTCKYWAGDCFTILPNDTSIQIKYLYNYLKAYNHVIMSKITGSTIPHCKWNDIINIELPIPPLPVQTEILAILNEMDAELKVLEQMATKAEERARYILDGYLSTPATVVEEEEEEAEPPSTTLIHEPLSLTLTHESPIPLTKPNYNAMSKPELLEQCKNNNIKGVSNKKKEELIKLLEAL